MDATIVTDAKMVIIVACESQRLLHTTATYWHKLGFALRNIAEQQEQTMLLVLRFDCDPLLDQIRQRHVARMRRLEHDYFDVCENLEMLEVWLAMWIQCLESYTKGW